MNTRVIVVSLAALFALTACATPTSSADLSTAPTSPSVSATPTSTPTPTINTASIPTDCATLVDSATYESTFGNTPLNDPSIAEYYPLGVLEPVVSAPDASIEQVIVDGTQLRCLWRDPGADITNLQVEIGTVPPATSDEYLGTLPAAGYTCESVLEGSRCTLTGTEPQYQVEEADTVFVRDDVVIHISQDNFPTNNLLGSVASGIWP